MKLLILDCNKFEYVLDHKTPVGEEISEKLKKRNYENPLVIFTAIEKEDDEGKLGRAVKDIKKIALKNKSKLVIVNPFAHLSSNLANPDIALLLSQRFKERLEESGDFKVIRGIFGWYKQFKIDVKGHGDSQIYKEY